MRPLTRFICVIYLVGFISVFSAAEDSSEEEEYEADSSICKKSGYKRHPYNCAKFYRCFDVWGTGIHFSLFEFNCPPNTVFDESLSVCSYPQQVSPPCGLLRPPVQKPTSKPPTVRPTEITVVVPDPTTASPSSSSTILIEENLELSTQVPDEENPPPSPESPIEGAENQELTNPVPEEENPPPSPENPIEGAENQELTNPVPEEENPPPSPENPLEGAENQEASNLNLEAEQIVESTTLGSENNLELISEP